MLCQGCQKDVPALVTNRRRLISKQGRLDIGLAPTGTPPGTPTQASSGSGHRSPVSSAKRDRRGSWGDSWPRLYLLDHRFSSIRSFLLRGYRSVLSGLESRKQATLGRCWETVGTWSPSDALPHSTTAGPACSPDSVHVSRRECAAREDPGHRGIVARLVDLLGTGGDSIAACRRLCAGGRCQPEPRGGRSIDGYA